MNDLHVTSAAAGEAADAPADATTLHQHTEFKLLEVAYARLPMSLLMTGVVTLVFGALLSHRMPPQLTLAWAGLVLGSVLLRGCLWRAYRRAAPGPASVFVWRRRYLVGSVVAGLAWTSGPVLMVSHGGGEGTSLLVGALLSVCAVAMNSQAAQRAAMQAFVVAALLPFAGAVLFSSSQVATLLTLVLLAGMVSLLMVGRLSSLALRQLIETQASLRAAADEAGVARQRAEAASRAKSRFLANMSHELRTPLGAVIGAAQLLRAEQGEPEQQAHLVDAIQRSGSNLLGLIENILDISRIEAGEMTLRPVDFHLVECLDAALAGAGLAAQAKGLRLACVVSPQLPAWRHGDADRLRQVVMNLLGNAVKFTHQGEVVVRVGPGTAPDAVRISVADTGVGIEAAALAHIFEPFRQADEGADRRYGGSGLGLAIVRQIVERMAGRIGVDSRPGVGSCFEFELPLALAPAAAAVAEPAPLLHRVVLHEPHEASAQALQAHLLRMGCNVQRCADGRQVRDALAGMQHGERPWLLLAAEAPGLEPLLEAVLDLIEPERVIVMAEHIDFDAARAGGAMHLPRRLVRPVTRATLVSRMTPAAGTVPGALQVPHSLLTAHELAALTHVLVVEDDELNRTIVCRLLQHGGHRVSAACDGQQALQLLAQPERVDLVLMDWQMPDMDGLEVTRRLRAGAAGERGRRVPIVALTANAFAEDRQACLAAGMNDFLSKPVQTGALMAAVQRWATRPLPAAAATPAARQAGQPDGAPVFDPAVLAALPMVADGSAPEYEHELLQLFMDSSAKALADIARAAAADDAAGLLRLVHTLKSTSASVGALELASLAAAHETQLRQGAAAAQDLSAQLQAGLQRLRAAIERTAHDATCVY